MMATIDPIALRLGPISIHWYAVCIVSGLLLAVYLAQRWAPEKGINPEHILDFILLAFPIAIVGARFYYVIFQWAYYSQNPSEIFAIWNGGIAIYGGLIAGAAVLYWFAKRHAIAVLDFLDIAAPGVMIAQSIGRWGNFVNQEAYGNQITNPSLCFFPYGVYIEEIGQWRQATFFYESALNLALLTAMLICCPHFRRKGYLLPFYMIGYGTIRLFVEGLRSDSLYLLPGIRVSQVLSGCLIILGIVILFIIRKRQAVRQ